MIGRTWSNYKKSLPQNYAQVVRKALMAKGFNLSIQQIKNLRSGRTIDGELQLQVWQTIRKLRKSHIEKNRRIDLLKSLRD